MDKLLFVFMFVRGGGAGGLGEGPHFQKWGANI